MKIIFVFFIFFSVITLYSQDQEAGSIQGKTFDYQTKKPLPYVTIICKSKNKVFSGAISNEKGFFTVTNLVLDSISVDIQFIGYKTITKKIHLTKTKKIIDFGNIYLQENVTQLDDIVITSETSFIKQKIDRKVITIGKDLASAGMNSLEMLENIPSVSVEPQSGTVTLRGNENVRVLIDGKPSNLSNAQLLEQIPSSSVKTVEIITNPSAKYSPEGMSGIINIVLKKNTTIGFNGSLDIGIQHSKNLRPNGSLNMNYRTGKVNFYGNYAIYTGPFETNALFNRTDKDLYQFIDYTDKTTTNYIKAGMDFYIDSKNTFSFYTSQSFSGTDFTIDTKTFENSNLIFRSPNLSVFDIKEEVYNANYKLNLDDKGQNIEFEVNFSKNESPQDNFNKELINPSSSLNNYTSAILNDNSIFLANIDYIKPLKGGNLEVGLEARIQKTFNKITTTQEIETVGTPSTRPRGNSTFNYDRDIYAAYVNYSKQFKKISIQAGLRLEEFTVAGLFSNTEQTNTEPYSDYIFSIYPSAFLTFSPSEKNQFQIGYSRRVDRPGIGQVTPIQEWVSPLSVSVGNRELMPQFTNSFEVNYTKMLEKGYWDFGVFYRKTSDKIGRIINKDAINSDKQLISYANYNSADSYGVEFSSSYKATKWWTIRPSASLYIQDSQGIINNQNETIKNTLFKARVSNSFKASKKLSFQLSTSYRGVSEGVQFRVQPYFLVNASARLSVLDGKGKISIRGTDIFDAYILDFSATNPFPQTGYFTLEYSSIYLGFSYNFGNGKKRERQRKYRENNETQKSIL